MSKYTYIDLVRLTEALTDHIDPLGDTSESQWMQFQAAVARGILLGARQPHFFDDQKFFKFACDETLSKETPNALDFP
jgi:hypothetical protein